MHHNANTVNPCTVSWSSRSVPVPEPVPIPVLGPRFLGPLFIIDGPFLKSYLHVIKLYTGCCSVQTFIIIIINNYDSISQSPITSLVCHSHHISYPAIRKVYKVCLFYIWSNRLPIYIKT